MLTLPPYLLPAQYGDVFTFVLLGRKMTVALGPKGSNMILNGRLSQVSAEDAYGSLTTPVFGHDVVYDCPNNKLMEQKKFIKFGLSTENLRLYVDMIKDEFDQFVAKDEQFASLKTTGKATCDVLKTFGEITILTASRTLQGREVRENLDKSFADLYHDLDAGFTPVNFVIPGLPLPINRRRDQAHAKLSDFYQGIVRARRERAKKGQADTEADMITALASQHYKNGAPLRDHEVAHMMIALLMAGQHTSTATGAWALLELARRPDWQNKLYDEQVKVFGDGNGGLDPLDYETLKTSLPVLDAIIKETLRLHPPIHSLMRKVISPLPVPPTLAAPKNSKNSNDTYVIPAGHYVIAAPIHSQSDPRVWKESDTYEPGRWQEKEVVNLDALDADADQQDFGWGMVSTGANSPYLPFGAGRHRCIGEQFAYLQLGTLLALFSRTFTWQLEGAMPPPDYQSMVILPTQPARIVFSLRK